MKGAQYAHKKKKSLKMQKLYFMILLYFHLKCKYSNKTEATVQIHQIHPPQLMRKC